MTGSHENDELISNDELAGELRARLISAGLAEGVNLLVRVDAAGPDTAPTAPTARAGHAGAGCAGLGGAVVRVQVMAVELGRLGLLLATLSDPAELAEPGSLSNRITPGGNDGGDGRWRYELVAGRYPYSREIVFSVVIRLPVSDVPAVLARLS
jgi:hypothetical protein